ncbi:MAG: fibronectin type III domain-containing protein [Steroidobacteraceae bacterium]
MKGRRTGLAALVLAASLAQAQTDVLVSHYDAGRTSQNLNEATLTTASVSVATFGRVYTFPVDGQVYAQPLYKSNLTIAGKGTFNVVFVATEHSSVYAFDADAATPIWHRSFINPATGLTSRPTNASLEDINPEVSITSTPVIDPTSNTLYVVAQTVQSGSPAYYWLHALDITTGLDKVTPVQVQASVGSGATPLNVNAATSQQRPGLFLLNGVVYVGVGSNGDNFPWVGWLVGYNATTLARVSVFCTSGDAAWGAGVWSSGQAPPVDPNGNIYVSTGNGTFNAGPDWADSWVKLSPSAGLTVADYFTPFNQAALGAADDDVAAAGLTLLPPGVGSATHPNLLVGTGKDGEIYLVDRDNMGKYNGSYTTPNSYIVQWIKSGIGGTALNPLQNPLPYAGNSYTAPAYWQNRVYLCGVSDACKLYTLSNGQLSSTPTSQAPTTFAYPGAQPVVSAASTSATSALMWAVEFNSTLGAGVLHAYDATNLATELYNSTQAANNRDTAGAPVKFAVPTVSGGKVFMGGAAGIDVYALLASTPQRLTAPTFSPAPSSYAGAQSVTITAAAGATIYYTLDGSQPTLASAIYTGPLNVAATTTINAMAVQSGKLTSTPAVGVYTISSLAQISYVQGNYATPQSPQTSVAVKFTAAQQQGDLNVVVVAWGDSSATVKSVTDTSGNVYAAAIGPTVLSGVASQSIYYAPNIPSAAANANTVTVAFNGSATYPDIRILEYSDIAGTSPLDVVSGATGSAGTASSGAVTTTNANDLLVGADVTLEYTLGAGAGFTSRMITVPDGDIAEDRVVTSIGSYAATATVSPAGPTIMQMVAFKGASGTAPVNPTAPSALAATAASATAINLTWVAATETGGSIAQYLIERCQGSGCSSFVQVGTATSTSYADSGLTGSTSYSYRVRAKDALGQTGPYSNTATAVTAAPTPGAPTNLAATASGSSLINLSWGKASEAGGTVSQYLIERCQGSGCSSFVQISTTSGLTYADSGVTGSTTYSYRVRAKDTLGDTGPYSNVATASTAASTITAPTNLTATSASSSQINLTWGAATETGGTISQYRIERCQGSGCSTFAQVATSTTTSYNDAALTAATTYSYRVRASDAGGNTGPYSNVASATTAAAGPPAIAFVQVNYATPQSAQARVTVPYTGKQSAGDLNVVVVSWGDSTATIGSLTDSSGNTYHLAVGPTVISGTASQAIYYAASIVGAAAGANTVSVSFTSAAVYPDVRVLEYSGIATTSPLDVVAAASGNNSLSSCGAVTTTNANDLIIAANVVYTTTTGPGAGFTNRVITVPDSDIAEDRIVSVTGSYTATAPLTPPAPWIMQLAAFKANP